MADISMKIKIKLIEQIVLFSVFVLASIQVMASTDTCLNIFVYPKAERFEPIPKTIGSWRKLIDKETIYTFNDTDPDSEVGVYYNWGPGMYAFKSIERGIPGKNLLDTFRYKDKLSQGLYVADEPWGRVVHGDTLMEVVVYKNQRPVVDGDGVRRWVPIENDEIAIDRFGVSDFLALSVASRRGHQDFVIKDPRVIKSFRWPSKEFILKEINEYFYTFLPWCRIHKSPAYYEVVGFYPFLSLASQVFISESFSAKDRREFLMAGEPAKSYVENSRGFLTSLFRVWVKVGEDTKNISELRAFDNFFKATINEQADFVHWSNKGAYFSFSTLIQEAKQISGEQLKLLEQVMPNNQIADNKLAKMVSLVLAVRAGDQTQVQNTMRDLRAVLELNVKELKNLKGWKMSWQALYEEQLLELDRTDAMLVAN
jgi:hypothetical protein